MRVYKRNGLRDDIQSDFDPSQDFSGLLTKNSLMKPFQPQIGQPPLHESESIESNYLYMCSFEPNIEDSLTQSHQDLTDTEVYETINVMLLN